VRYGERLAEHWHNTTRLHGYLHDVPPAEFEAVFLPDTATPPGLETNSPSLVRASG
jgi:hypothetical protein